MTFSTLKASLTQSSWGWVPLLPIWLAAWTFLWPLAFFFGADEIAGWLHLGLAVLNMELLWRITKQLWPERWFAYWLLGMGVLLTTVAVHLIGVFWLALVCPFVGGTAVYPFLESRLLCFEGQVDESATLFGLMWGALLAAGIFTLAVWSTIKHGRRPERPEV